MRKIGMLSAVLLGTFGAFASNDVCAMDLSLQDAVDKIVAESQDLKKADANVKKAQASLDAANANRWFSVDGSVSYMNLINVKQPFKSYGVDLPPEIGGIVST